MEETLERITKKYEQNGTTYYFIIYQCQKVGVIRFIDKGRRGRISPMFILPRFQNRHIGKAAVLKLEEIHRIVDRWSLDTILQEESLCCFYESLGYKRTGDKENIKDGMDIVFYEKEV